VKASDPGAAAVYYRAWSMLPPDKKNIAMNGIKSCIEAYKTRSKTKDS